LQRGELTVAKYRTKKIDIREVEEISIGGDKYYRVWNSKNECAIYPEKEFHEKFEKVENQSEVL